MNPCFALTVTLNCPGFRGASLCTVTCWTPSARVSNRHFLPEDPTTGNAPISRVAIGVESPSLSDTSTASPP